MRCPTNEINLRRFRLQVKLYHSPVGRQLVRTLYPFSKLRDQDENARVDMSVLCYLVTKFKLLVLRFLVDVYALYALYKQAYNDFQDILVRIIAKFKHNKIITSRTI